MPSKPAPGTAVTVTFDVLLERMKPKIAAILPKHITPERMLALVSLMATRMPELKKCTPLSLFNGIVHAARLGLEIGTLAHLVPFKNGKTGQTDAVFIPDYRGLIALAVRSGVRHIDARVVYRSDVFRFEQGTRPEIHHTPDLGSTNRADENIIAFYAVAHLADGATAAFEVMSKAEVDGIKERSRAKNNGPWVTDYASMGKKTVVKRLAKFLPQSPELQAAIELDTRAETGEISTVSDIIDSKDSVNDAVAERTRERTEALREELTGEGGPEAPGPTEPPVTATSAAAAAASAKGKKPPF